MAYWGLVLLCSALSDTQKCQIGFSYHPVFLFSSAIFPKQTNL